MIQNTALISVDRHSSAFLIFVIFFFFTCILSSALAPSVSWPIPSCSSTSQLQLINITPTVFKQASPLINCFILVWVHASYALLLQHPASAVFSLFLMDPARVSVQQRDDYWFEDFVVYFCSVLLCRSGHVYLVAFFLSLSYPHVRLCSPCIHAI